MKWMNESNLPAPIVSAVTEDAYKKSGEFSVSGLIKPPQVLQLTTRHEAKIVADVKNQLHVLLGKAMHAILEMAGQRHLTHLVEQELVTRVSGVAVSGRPDCVALEDGVLTDYKTTSVWSFLRGVKSEWVAQLNVYAWMLREKGVAVSRLQVVALLRDWTSSKIHENDYPPCGMMVVPVVLWTDQECRAYVETRVSAHVVARDLPDDELPQCTAEERWERPPQFVVMKTKDAKRAAVATEDGKPLTEAQAAEIAAEKGMVVARRAGESVRCARFCKALPFCRQGKWLVPPNERRAEGA